LKTNHLATLVATYVIKAWHKFAAKVLQKSQDDTSHTYVCLAIQNLFEFNWTEINQGSG
jgi:hypothetical protein